MFTDSAPLNVENWVSTKRREYSIAQIEHNSWCQFRIQNFKRGGTVKWVSIRKNLKYVNFLHFSELGTSLNLTTNEVVANVRVLICMRIK